ncbi:MAG: lysophospholipid acyltransferase family protein [Pseudomonadota bacterium]|nr:lysophospholipid acyltransferase family protein [Pseudomonadota bacterium]
MTGQWRIDGTEIPTDMLKEGKPFLVAFWHGRLLMMSLAWPYQQNLKMVISRHRDGELIARTIKFLGFDSISGSSSRGGAGTMRSILRALKSGEYVGVTPDGPRGPRMRAAKGIVFAACHAGVPILPLSYAARSCKTLPSWDRFLIPLPFCRGIIKWGKPIAITSNADEKEILQKTSDLEKQLNFLTNQLDDELGLDRVTPETETKL